MARRKGFASKVSKVARFIADPAKAMRPKSIRSQAFTFAKAINKTRKGFHEIQGSFDRDNDMRSRIKARSPENTAAYEAVVRRQHGDSIYRIFYKNLVGVSFNNRKANIRTLKEHQELHLLPEPTNPIDPNAIIVTDLQGRDIGHLDARLAGEVSRSLAKGVHWHCYVRRVLHTKGTDHYGATICLVKHTKEPSVGNGKGEKRRKSVSSPTIENPISITIHEARPAKAVSLVDRLKKMFGRKDNVAS